LLRAKQCQHIAMQAKSDEDYINLQET